MKEPPIHYCHACKAHAPFDSNREATCLRCLSRRYMINYLYHAPEIFKSAQDIKRKMEIIEMDLASRDKTGENIFTYSHLKQEL